MICKDKVLLDDWYVVAESALLKTGEKQTTILLGVELQVMRDTDGDVSVVSDIDERRLPVAELYGFVWASLGTPARDIVHIPESFEPDRYLVPGGAIGVKVSGLRVVENFLDLGHLAFIHDGWLGEEPHTEVEPYNVTLTDDDEIVATECRVYQPQASPTAKTGFMVDYTYQVHRPFIVSLTKTNPTYKERFDFVVLFIQPVAPEQCIVHPYLCYVKDGMGEDGLRSFMQLIFSQDKPILENQLPKSLPLNPRAETPIRADKSAILYRRWLTEKQVTYGTIPAAA